MKNYKKIISELSFVMCFLFVGCSGSKGEISEDTVGLTVDKEVSEDGNYVVVVEIKDGVEDVSYTLIENGKIIESEDDVNEAILKENVMQNKRAGDYKYTLNVKDSENNVVTKELTVEVKEDKKDMAKDKVNDSENVVEANTNNVVQSWDSDSKEYVVGDLVRFNDKTYSCLQGHTSQEAWDPASAVSLWKEKK